MLLLVSKKDLRAQLRTLPIYGHTSHLLQSYTVAIGKEGDKEKEGDNKTPEGIYFTYPHIEKERLRRSKYGEKLSLLIFLIYLIWLRKKQAMEFGFMELVMIAG